MIEINENNLNIRSVIRITGAVLQQKLSDKQIDKVVETLKTEVADEEKFFLKFGGMYILVCKEHPNAKTKIIKDDKDNYKWICEQCNQPLIPLPVREAKEIKKEAFVGVELPEDEMEIFRKIESKEIDYDSLSAGKKAYITRLKNRLNGGA